MCSPRGSKQLAQRRPSRRKISRYITVTSALDSLRSAVKSVGIVFGKASIVSSGVFIHKPVISRNDSVNPAISLS